MRIGITGANGYVGSVLCAALAERGHEVVAFLRARTAGLRPTPGMTGFRNYAIDQPPPPADLADLDALIHCAWDLQLTDGRDIWRVNVAGTQSLMRNASAAGVRRIVFISSMSAYEGTHQLYGRAKLECERAVSAVGGVGVRLGLVYGPGWGGMAGVLRKLALLPVTPVIGSRSYQFTLHEADMASAIALIVESDLALPQPIGLAHPEPVPFAQLLRRIAASQGRTCRPMPVPWRIVLGLLMIAEALRLPLKLRSDSVLGLIRPASHVPGRDKLKELGIELRHFSPGASVAESVAFD